MQTIQINQIIHNQIDFYLKDFDIVYIGLIGSRYWHTELENSDWDFAVIVKNCPNLFESYKVNNLNFHLWNYDNFKNALKNSNPLAWEWLNYSQVIKGNLPDLNYLVNESVLLQRIIQNTKEEFSNKNLTYKQANWKKRYEGFIKHLEA